MRPPREQRQSGPHLAAGASPVRRQKAGTLLLSACLLVTPAPAATLSITCGTVGKEYELCRSGAEAWGRESGHEIRVVTAPGSTNERLALYQQLLAAGSADVDVFQIDVIWPGMLASHLVDLTAYAGERANAHLPVLIANNTVAGRLVALPWFTSMGLLYYRKDLLAKHGQSVPDTWQALTAVARHVQEAERAAGNSKMWGYVWQGRAYEGLTCNALEWVASHGGGTILEADGGITIDNPRAEAGLALAAGWVGTISPPGTLNYGEEEARSVFQSGNAVFMRNWPYAWALAQSPDSPVRNKVAVAPLPRGHPGGQRASTFGGWQLAVSKYSRHPDLAADLVLHLTSPTEQKRRSLEAAYNPTIRALYRDPELREANPILPLLEGALAGSVTRPSSVAGPAYSRISARFWNAAHSVLAGRQSARGALQRLQRDLERLRRRAGW